MNSVEDKFPYGHISEVDFILEEMKDFKAKKDILHHPITYQDYDYYRRRLKKAGEVGLDEAICEFFNL